MAQISVEIKSIKSIEDAVYNLRSDLQNLKNYELAGRSSSPNRLSEKNNSDPNLFNKSMINEINHEENHNQYDRRYNAVVKSYESRSELYTRKQQDFLNEKERLRAWVPTYSNPRKLKKLTKYTFFLKILLILHIFKCVGIFKKVFFGKENFQIR